MSSLATSQYSLNSFQWSEVSLENRVALQNPWNLALSRAESMLRASDCTLVYQVRTCEDLVNALQTYQLQKTSSGFTGLLMRLTPFITRMKTFADAIDVFIQSNPKIAALVWGGIRVLITVVSRSTDLLNKVIDTMTDLAPSLPRFEIYTQLFQGSQHFENALAQVYLDVVEFCIGSITFFRQNPVMNVLRNVWTSFESRFGPVCARLRKDSDLVDREAFAAYAVKGEHRHRELMDMMSASSHPTETASTKIPCHVVPHIAPSSFAGRDHILRAMHEYFEGTSNTAQQRCFVLYGQAGVGKTQTALRFSYDSMHRFPALFWVSADTETKLLQEFQNIAVALRLDKSAAAMRPTQARDLVLEWFKNTDVEFLIVFDNVEDLPTLQPFVPKCDKGCILITTRYPGMKLSLSSQLRHVKPFDDDFAAQLLLSLSQQPSENLSIARRVAKKLGGLALGLAHAAGVIRETPLSLSEFDELYDSRDGQIEIHALDSKQTVFQYERSLSTAWDVSFCSLSDESRMLLDLMFFMDPDGIPEKVFHLAKALPQYPDVSFLTSKVRYIAAISRLSRRSLIERNVPLQLLSLHRLLQLELTRSWTTDRRQLCFNIASSILECAFPPHPDGLPMNDRWDNCAQLLPHALALVAAYKSERSLEAVQEFPELLTRVGWYTYERQAHITSISLYEVAEKICLDRFPESLLLADVYTGLCCNMKNLNRNKEAVAYAEKIVRIRGKLLPPVHIQVANSYNEIGISLNCLGKIEEAAGYHRKSIAIKEQLGNCPLILMCQSYLNLARCLTRLGLLEEARKSAEDALRYAQADPIPYKPYIAINLYICGNALLAQGALEDAISLHVQSLLLRKQLLGRGAFYTGLSCHKVATLRFQQGSIEEAIELMKEALSIFEEIPEVEGDVARSCVKLGVMLERVGQHADARPFFKRAKVIHQKITGKELGDSAKDIEAYESLTAYDNR
ncbi:TPR-like protein [Karstenula rhodostoma CBS 690.94]|uniref:TPR-like protein n=1 Tax=Karstenula rhodostoma CBS 690.94 TaxID=1392251 RepID=A0A9P4U5G8_9PLEO|nr:TPR-like protein [Karstenula rhodostoma CBS 690.94]